MDEVPPCDGVGEWEGPKSFETGARLMGPVARLYFRQAGLTPRQAMKFFCRDIGPFDAAHMKFLGTDVDSLPFPSSDEVEELEFPNYRFYDVNLPPAFTDSRLPLPFVSLGPCFVGFSESAGSDVVLCSCMESGIDTLDRYFSALEETFRSNWYHPEFERFAPRADAAVRRALNDLRLRASEERLHHPPFTGGPHRSEQLALFDSGRVGPDEPTKFAMWSACVRQRGPGADFRAPPVGLHGPFPLAHLTNFSEFVAAARSAYLPIELAVSSKVKKYIHRGLAELDDATSENGEIAFAPTELRFAERVCHACNTIEPPVDERDPFLRRRWLTTIDSELRTSQGLKYQLLGENQIFSQAALRIGIIPTNVLLGPWYAPLEIDHALASSDLAFWVGERNELMWPDLDVAQAMHHRDGLTPALKSRDNERAARLRDARMHLRHAVDRSLEEVWADAPWRSKRWRSEASLAGLVAAIFPNEKLLRNARPSWLQGLELDVYLPDRDLAFEYNGIQHYRPIKFFGGASSFKQRLMNDERKRLLCRERGVTLVTVSYRETLSQKLIRQKVASAANEAA